MIDAMKNELKTYKPNSPRWLDCELNCVSCDYAPKCSLKNATSEEAINDFRNVYKQYPKVEHSELAILKRTEKKAKRKRSKKKRIKKRLREKAPQISAFALSDFLTLKISLTRYGKR